MILDFLELFVCTHLQSVRERPLRQEEYQRGTSDVDEDHLD